MMPYKYLNSNLMLSGDWQTGLYGNVQWKDSSKLLLLVPLKITTKVLEQDKGDYSSTIHLKKYLGLRYVFEMHI